MPCRPRVFKHPSSASATVSTRSSGVRHSYQKRKSSASESSHATLARVHTQPRSSTTRLRSGIFKQAGQCRSKQTRLLHDILGLSSPIVSGVPPVSQDHWSRKFRNSLPCDGWRYRSGNLAHPKGTRQFSNRGVQVAELPDCQFEDPGLSPPFQDVQTTPAIDLHIAARLMPPPDRPRSIRRIS